jgi:hypothetical protein
MNKTKIILAGSALMVGVFALISVHSAIASDSFSNIVTIADQNTHIPGSLATFTWTRFPVISGNTVVFTGGTFDSGSGIYRFKNGDLSTIADTDTMLPGAAYPGAYFSGLAVNGDNIAFCAFTPKSNIGGIYLSKKGRLIKVVDTKTKIPDTKQTFEVVESPSVNGEQVVFYGLNGTLSGIYLFDGQKLVVVANGNTLIPGTREKFGGIGCRFGINSNGNVVFYGSNQSWTEQGIYLYNGKKIITIADSKTRISGTHGQYNYWFSSISGNNISFYGENTAGSERGIFIFDGRRYSTIVNAQTPIPGTAGKFGQFEISDIQISGNNVVFSGNYWYGPTGIYSHEGKTLTCVADTDTEIPGTKTKFEGFDSFAVDGGNVVFNTDSWSLTNGSAGVYLLSEGKAAGSR